MKFSEREEKELEEQVKYGEVKSSKYEKGVCVYMSVCVCVCVCVCRKNWGQI